MANTLTTVDFHGQTLLVTLIDGQPAVALRPVCDAIGLDWAAQLQRIKRNPVLASTVCVITTVAQDGKQRETTCLPLDKLNGWLFGISAARVKPELRERLIQYQRECFDVLARHFGAAPAQPTTITPAQQQHLKELVDLVVESGKQTKTNRQQGGFLLRQEKFVLQLPQVLKTPTQAVGRARKNAAFLCPKHSCLRPRVRGIQHPQGE